MNNIWLWHAQVNWHNIFSVRENPFVLVSKSVANFQKHLIRPVLKHL